ncbi:unnamed protein product [Tuber melanosporum]|uniref:(Perigord truffle) hypothetical protein n=1 Tax=Tuber melanosporum (strain Mel28) TaxID=656061 RepID=D5G4V2_TUBMM|nr:uncharacterized protein GSTUM_00000098001 [Tuber melanosporum]CAZ79545.1 unnamed protein product [Tuber melanosporum]
MYEYGSVLIVIFVYARGKLLRGTMSDIEICFRVQRTFTLVLRYTVIRVVVRFVYRVILGSDKVTHH